MALRWADYITPSTLHLAPLLELLLEPISCADQLAALQLGLQEVLVNAVRHGNGSDPSKCLRVRRILTPHWLVFQVQDEGCATDGFAPAQPVHQPDQPDVAFRQARLRIGLIQPVGDVEAVAGPGPPGLSLQGVAKGSQRHQ